MRFLIAIAAVASLSGCISMLQATGLINTDDVESVSERVGDGVKRYCGATTDLDQAEWRKHVDAHSHPHLIRITCDRSAPPEAD